MKQFLKVVRVHCKQRIGSDDFIASIRKTLARKYADKTVGMIIISFIFVYLRKMPFYTFAFPFIVK